MPLSRWFFAALLAPATALAAPDKKTCAASYEKAQLLYKDTNYSAAREELAVCTDASCPSWITTDCLKWLADIEQNQPTIVVVARDAKGADLGDNEVRIDGAIVAEHDRGAPLKVELGEHVLRVVRKDERGVERSSEASFIARAGDKNRQVIVTFGAEAPPAKKAVEVEHVGSPLPAIVIGAIGLGLVGASVGIGVSAQSDIDALRATCAPRCAQGDIDAANTKAAISTALTFVGIGAIAAGVIVFLLRPKFVEHTVARSPFRPIFQGGSASLAIAF